ncbi:unnamed protein product, partial [Ixodes pacificus]
SIFETSETQITKPKQNPATRLFLGTKPSAVNKRRRPIITELIPHAEHFPAQIRRRPTWCLAELVRRGTDNYDNPRRRQAGRQAGERASKPARRAWQGRGRVSPHALAGGPSAARPDAAR